MEKPAQAGLTETSGQAGFFCPLEGAMLNETFISKILTGL